MQGSEVGMCAPLPEYRWWLRACLPDQFSLPSGWVRLPSQWAVQVQDIPRLLQRLSDAQMRPDTQCFQMMVSSVQHLFRLRDIFRQLSPNLVPTASGASSAVPVQGAERDHVHAGATVASPHNKQRYLSGLADPLMCS